jgi:hypothetical protein
MTTPGESKDQQPNVEPWQPRWWVRLTTVTAFGWGLGLGTWEALNEARTAVFGFAGALVLVGLGLAGAASLVFNR